VGVQAYIYLQDFSEAVLAELRELGLGDQVPSALEMAALFRDKRRDVDVTVEKWLKTLSERRGREAEGEGRWGSGCG
jgi:hypothetical protein